MFRTLAHIGHFGQTPTSTLCYIKATLLALTLNVEFIESSNMDVIPNYTEIPGQASVIRDFGQLAAYLKPTTACSRMDKKRFCCHNLVYSTPSLSTCYIIPCMVD